MSETGFTEDELRVYNLIVEAMEGIQNLNGRKLRANAGELATAVHVLQGFVVQAACRRLGLFDASDWWEDQPPATPGVGLPEVRGKSSLRVRIVGRWKSVARG